MTRIALLIAVATVGVVGVLADDAHAVAVGPVAVPVTVPPLTLGPVTVAVPGGASQPVVSVGVAASPLAPVAIDVTTPPALHPDSFLHRPPPPSTSIAGSPAATTPAAAPALPPPTAPNAAPVAASDPAAAAAQSVGVTAPAPDGTTAVRARPAPPSASIGAAPLPISATLRHRAPAGTWSVLRAAASARGLWLALAIILLVALYLARSLLYDAMHRARALNSV